MGRGLVLAWVTGIGLMMWREVKAYHKPPVPGRIAAASGIYVGLGMLGSYQPAAGAATLAAWGFTLAVILQPGVLTSTKAGAMILPTPSGGKAPSGTAGNPIGEAP